MFEVLLRHIKKGILLTQHSLAEVLLSKSSAEHKRSPFAQQGKLKGQTTKLCPVITAEASECRQVPLCILRCDNSCHQNVLHSFNSMWPLSRYSLASVSLHRTRRKKKRSNNYSNDNISSHWGFQKSLTSSKLNQLFPSHESKSKI